MRVRARTWVVLVINFLNASLGISVEKILGHNQESASDITGNQSLKRCLFHLNTPIKEASTLINHFNFPQFQAYLALSWDFSSMKKVLYISMLCERESSHYEITLKSPELADDSGKWIEMRLSELGGSIAAEYSVNYLNIAQGDTLPTPETTASYDFVILGGTFHDVCCANLNPEGREWQRPLQDWLLQQRQTGQPLLGICGGHQAMAVALGGEVTRRGIKGTAAGSLCVILTDEGKQHPLMQNLSQLESDCAFHFANGDEVSSMPPGTAKVLATSIDSLMVAMDYGNGWVSTQFHPEASHTAFQHWVDSGVILPPPSEEKKYRSLASGRNLINNFLKG